MAWTLEIPGKVKKQGARLPAGIQEAFEALAYDITILGPVLAHWPHYGKLVGRPGYHHCHLNKGKPRYVAVWLVIDKNVRLVEVRYVGTHEDIDYGKIR